MGVQETVNYNGLVGLLIEVVKDQQKQIDTLSERISKLNDMATIYNPNIVTDKLILCLMLM